MKQHRLSELLAEPFYETWRDIKLGRYTDFDETGGRGSTKSSAISIMIVNGMMLDRQKGEITHAVCLRQVGKDLRESVFEQIGWAIDKLEVGHLWKKTQSPMKWIYMPNSKYPQEIRFRGCDDPHKVKSIKFSYGRPKYLWFEEKDQFKSASDINSIKLSIARKNDGDDLEADDTFITLSSYNPPQNPSHWINIDAKVKKSFRKQHHTDYTMIPQKWLTKAFLEEAEAMKENDINEYNHTFLGLVTGLKGLCYPQFDINKHTIPFKEFKFYQMERVVRVVCGCDGGTINDNTTLSPMMLTTAGRIVMLPTFCYDPQNLNHTPLAPSLQVRLMEHWLDVWLRWLYVNHNQRVDESMVTIVVDSAAQDLVLEFNTITKYEAIRVPKKDILLDMKRHQQVLSVPNYFLLLNAGYINPTTIDYDDRTLIGEVVSDYDKYIEEVMALCIDEKTNKPIDANNHTIDGFNYGLYIATQS